MQTQRKPQNHHSNQISPKASSKWVLERQVHDLEAKISSLEEELAHINQQLSQPEDSDHAKLAHLG
ncbi:MAG: ABC transporter C-terminal domain-containing protein [Deinococcales bacterium]